MESNIPEITQLSDVKTASPEVKQKFPTETIDLPSKGMLYPKEHPLSSGTVELKYMTAKEEDILSTQSYITKGTVLDELLQSIIVTKFDYNTLLLGDRNAIMIAARALGYGDMYQTTITKPNGTRMDLTINLREDIDYLELNEELITPGENKFQFTTPRSGHEIEFSLLTVGKYNKLEKALKSYKKIGTKVRDKQMTTRLRYMITSVNGDASDKTIATFVDTMLALDARAFRDYIASVQPDLDLNLETEDPASGDTFRGKVAVGVDLFYPDFKK